MPLSLSINLTHNKCIWELPTIGTSENELIIEDPIDLDDQEALYSQRLSGFFTETPPKSFSRSSATRFESKELKFGGKVANASLNTSYFIEPNADTDNNTRFRLNGSARAKVYLLIKFFNLLDVRVNGTGYVKSFDFSASAQVLDQVVFSKSYSKEYGTKFPKEVWFHNDAIFRQQYPFTVFSLPAFVTVSLGGEAGSIPWNVNISPASDTAYKSSATYRPYLEMYGVIKGIVGVPGSVPKSGQSARIKGQVIGKE